MSSMLVAAIVAARRRSYVGRDDHESHSNSSTKVDPIIFCKLCDEKQVDAAKKRLDERLHPQPTSRTNRSSMKGKVKERGNSKAWKKP